MQNENITDQTSPSAELQVAGLIAKFEPKNQKLINSVRGMLQKRFPMMNELVYHYTKSLVISYSPNEYGKDGFVAFSADPNGLRLFFNYGLNLPDPHNILQGDGRQTRYIRIEESNDILRPEVESLLEAVTGKVPISPDNSGRGELIIKSSKKKTKSGSAKPRRPGPKGA